VSAEAAAQAVCGDDPVCHYQHGTQFWALAAALDASGMSEVTQQMEEAVNHPAVQLAYAVTITDTVDRAEDVGFSSKCGLAVAGMFAVGKLEKIDDVGDALKSPDEVAATTKRVPNPWGRRGSPNHVARIQEAEERIADRGWKTALGGSLPEEKYGKRYPDLVMQREAAGSRSN
jgi:hypothetical protein